MFDKGKEGGRGGKMTKERRKGGGGVVVVDKGKKWGGRQNL